MVEESQRPLQRRLAGIMSLDVVGYGRMMGRAEDATHRRVADLLARLVTSTVASCDGRVFKNTGDGVLAEFSSIVQATLCAIEIQQEMRDAAQRPEEDAVRFRIGVNSGEVIIEADDVYGDEVNVAV